MYSVDLIGEMFTVWIWKSTFFIKKRQDAGFLGFNEICMKILIVNIRL